MFFYASKALLAHPGRACSIAAGFALAFAAVLLAYAIAGAIQISSSAALGFVIKGNSVWIVAPGRPRIDPTTHALVQDTKLAPSAERAVRASNPGAVRAISVERTLYRGVPVTIYHDSAVDSTFASPLLMARLQKSAAPGGAPLPPLPAVRSDLPGLSLVEPLDRSAPQIPVTWLLASPNNTGGWGREIAAVLGSTLRDSAAMAPDSKTGSVFLLEGSLSRFDPFSFQTKFSAFQVNAATSTLLGWLARAIFAFGALLVVSSARLGIAERRAEVAALAVLGFQPEITLLILIENAILLAVATPIAFLLAALMATTILPLSDVLASLAAGAGLTLFFVPVVLVAATLWAGQYIAGQSEVVLVRGGI